jgi:hypothetical protein
MAPAFKGGWGRGWKIFNITILFTADWGYYKLIPCSIIRDKIRPLSKCSPILSSNFNPMGPICNPEQYLLLKTYLSVTGFASFKEDSA